MLEVKGEHVCVTSGKGRMKGRKRGYETAAGSLLLVRSSSAPPPCLSNQVRRTHHARRKGEHWGWAGATKPEEQGVVWAARGRINWPFRYPVRVPGRWSGVTSGLLRNLHLCRHLQRWWDDDPWCTFRGDLPLRPPHLPRRRPSSWPPRLLRMDRRYRLIRIG